MARERPHLFALNGGAVSPLALGRTDLARMRITAEEFNNCFPKVIGPLQFRPGLEYEGTTRGDAVARHIPFIFSAEDTALIELTNLIARPLINGDPITRVAVSSTIQNGDFSASTGWTLTSANINSTVSGALVLQPTARGITARAQISFAVASGDQAKEHGIRIVITRGNARFKLGSTSGGQDIIPESELGPGVHSLAFTPNTATVYLEFNSQAETQVVVDSAQIEAAGEVTLDTPWLESEIFDARYVQSGDVIFVVHELHQPRRIERRATRSWSVTRHVIANGPWKGKTANVTLDPTVSTGNGTMTSDAAFFTPNHVGALFELTHTATQVSNKLAGNDVYTDWVRVAGYKANGDTDATNERIVAFTRTSGWVGTITEYSADSEDGPWLPCFDGSGSASYSRHIGFDGQITYYRLGFAPGNYTSGTITVTMKYNGGGGSGVVRVTGYTSPTSVSIEVVSRLHSSAKCNNWREGLWSAQQGWPSAVEIFEGRLWFGSADKLAGSASDDFVTFYDSDPTDASPIVRSVASGPVNKVQWLLGLARLMVGTSGAESSARSSSFDEPMTPTNFSVKDASNIGSSDVQAVKVDRAGVFINRAGKRAHILGYSIDAQDYTASELSRYNPSVLFAGVKVMAVQRQPDTRIWFVLNDGTAAVLTYEPAEDVLAWTTFQTDGLIEDVTVLPNTDGDDVYMIVARTINGVAKRYREHLAYEQNAEGGSLNRMADCFKKVTVAATSTVAGLDHLEAKSVVVWQGDAPLVDTNGTPQTFTVTSGQITLPQSFTGDVVVGIPYEGRFKSTKLAYAASQGGSAVTQRKIINRISPLLYKTHIGAVTFGQDFDTMDKLPRYYRGADQGVNTLLDDYDSDGFTLPGSWSTDSRLCMKFRAPLPATVLGVVLEMEGHERG